MVAADATDPVAIGYATAALGHLVPAHSSATVPSRQRHAGI